VIVATALTLGVLSAVPSSATFAKKYDLTVSPGTAAEGSTRTFSVTFKNESLYPIKSVKIYSPWDDAPVKELPTVYYKLNTPATVQVAVDIDCGAGSGAWRAEAFGGKTFTGSLFTLDNQGPAQVTTVEPAGPGTLAFGVQPTNTTRGDVIAPAVTVSASDACGDPADDVEVSLVSAPAGLPQASATTDDGGVATFSNLKLTENGTYTLLASAAGYTGDESDPFQIADAVIGCGDTVTVEGVTLIDQGTAGCEEGNAFEVSKSDTEFSVVSVGDDKEDFTGIIVVEFTTNASATTEVTWPGAEDLYPPPAFEGGFHPAVGCDDGPALPAGTDELMCLVSELTESDGGELVSTVTLYAEVDLGGRKR